MMNNHEWELTTDFSMTCTKCGEIILADDSEKWNMEIFADCTKD
jgi:hypothetical protein